MAGKQIKGLTAMKKQPKLKTYVLMVSRVFPTTHPRKGQETGFPNMVVSGYKSQTVRGKYEAWARKAIEVQAGRAVVSVRIWTGKPYASQQQEIAELSHINVQKVHIYKIPRTDWVNDSVLGPRWHIFIDNSIQPLRWPFKFAARDGLTMPDFLGWFKKPVEDAALIHFTNFKY